MNIKKINIFYIFLGSESSSQIFPHLKGSDSNLRFNDLKSIPEAAEMRHIPSLSNEDPTPTNLKQIKSHRRIPSLLTSKTI